MENKYKVGDVVKVKSIVDCDDITDFTGGFFYNMEEYCETEVTIKKVNEYLHGDKSCYEVKDNYYTWDERVLESIFDKEEKQ